MTSARVPYRWRLFKPERWTERAACQDVTSPDLFFSYAAEQIEHAKAICETCPVIDECLDYAQRTRQPDGVWGGLTELERRRRRLRLRSVQ